MENKGMQMSEKLSPYLDMGVVMDLLDAKAIVYLTTVLLIFYIGKKVYDLIIPYDLNKELVEVDNKAVALSVSGYFFGLGIILWGVLGDSPEKVFSSKGEFHMDLLAVLGWGCVGIILLQIARIINDKIVLYQFDNIKEIITDKNLGTGAVQFGAFIASGLVIRGSLMGDGNDLGMSFLSVLVFFVISQLCFIIYSKCYQFLINYDLHAEIEKDNVAAGVAFGMSLIAEGILLSGYMVKHDSIFGLLAWFVMGTALLFISRILVDKFILPGHSLDDEISLDQNWGAALIEGTTAITFALVLNAAF